MKRLSIIFMVCVLSLAVVPHLHAQDEDEAMKKVGQSTMNFLKVGISARATGMANTYTAIGGDAACLFYNPAGIASIEGFDVHLGMTQWIADINYMSGALAKDVGNIGVFGLSFLIVDYGDIPRTELLSGIDPKGYKETGSIENVGAFAFGLGYARQISTQFAIGGQAQYVGQQLGTSTVVGEEGVKNNEVSKLSYNFGVLFYPGFRSLRLGMSIRNFSSTAKYEEVTAELPLIFNTGIAMDVMDLINPEHDPGNALLVSTEFAHPNNYTERVNFGLEYKLMGLAYASCGYQFNRDVGGLTFGIGATPSIGGKSLRISYSYSDPGDFGGMVNRFSAGFSF